MSVPVFLHELQHTLPSTRIITDELRRFALSTDASFYRLVPEAIVQVDSDEEMVLLLRLAAKHAIPLTFRAAGTSLSGQAVTNSVLVVLTDSWLGIRVEPLAERVHLQPGVIGAKANRALQPYGRKIGPDPASINACKVGGIIANNASGMCCGTQHNSYHTLAAMKLILADGSMLDTRDEQSTAAFRQSHASLLQGLSDLRGQLLANNALTERVRHKYRLKNTTGYGLNALLDFDDPVDILTHLIIGSEGTLGFVSEVTLNTVLDLPDRASAMVAFADLSQCAETVALLKQAPVDAVELLDARSIASVSHMPGLPAFAKDFPAQGGVLLIDVRGANPGELERNVTAVEQVLNDSQVSASTGFTTDSSLIDDYWHIRKGTFPAVGAAREVGTTVIIEDVAFPIERLADGVVRLQQLFDQYHYDEAIIFGHALEGNLHFVFTQAFDSEAEITRYQGFMADVAQLVAVEFGGSLKAEHGTGRNMAPFVALEWGSDGYDLMRQVKHLLDPNNLLNPGVILNDDDQIHLKNLKPMPAADDVVDRCIECGFCEDVCPSTRYSLTPRQRISVYRETQRRQRAREPISRQWDADFAHLGVDSCAATGLCQQKCPVNINTGELVLKLRARKNHPYRRLASFMVRHFAVIAGWVRVGLLFGYGLQKVFGATRLERLSGLLRRLSGGRLPLWLSTTPGRSRPVYARNERVNPGAEDTVVYWPSCVSQSMGKSVEDDRQQIPKAVRSVLAKANLKVVYPQPTRGLCCGQPFHSKGQFSAAERMMNEVLDALWEVSSGGRYPVLSDTSPCALSLHQAAQQRGIHLYDSAEFIDRFILNRVEVRAEDKPVAVHLTCSAQKMGQEKSLQRVVRRLAPNFIQPTDVSCCGFAGDKGFVLPELNAAALKPLAPQVSDCAFGISTSRTCEIGLSKHSGLTYYSLFEVLDRQSTSLTEKELEEER